MATLGRCLSGKASPARQPYARPLRRKAPRRRAALRSSERPRQAPLQMAWWVLDRAENLRRQGESDGKPAQPFQRSPQVVMPFADIRFSGGLGICGCPLVWPDPTHVWRKPTHSVRWNRRTGHITSVLVAHEDIGQVSDQAAAESGQTPRAGRSLRRPLLAGLLAIARPLAWPYRGSQSTPRPRVCPLARLRRATIPFRATPPHSTHAQPRRLATPSSSPGGKTGASRRSGVGRSCWHRRAAVSHGV
jgi:hypothetical protein